MKATNEIKFPLSSPYEVLCHVHCDEDKNLIDICDDIKCRECGWKCLYCIFNINLTMFLMLLDVMFSATIYGTRISL